MILYSENQTFNVIQVASYTSIYTEIKDSAYVAYVTKFLAIKTIYRFHQVFDRIQSDMRFH